MSAVINIFLNLILIPIWGLNAAAMTTAISEFVGIIMKIPFIDKNIRIYGLRQVFIAPIIGCVGIIGVSGLVRRVVDSSYLIAIFTIAVRRKMV